MKPDVYKRVRGAYGRRMAKWFGRRLFRVSCPQPLISFTFDDFPRSALFTGGRILEQHGITGTYYIALGLMTRIEPTGEIFHAHDLPPLLARGHEVGCHTYDHCPAWETTPSEYETSVIRNAAALPEFASHGDLQTHSYPISHPRPGTKRRLAPRFRGCRGGGQTFNHGIIDLNYISSFFLEQSRDDFNQIERVIETNSEAGGWLIFSTHDVSKSPTRFGVQPDLFEKVVRCSVRSGAKILLMSRALETIGCRPTHSSHGG